MSSALLKGLSEEKVEEDLEASTPAFLASLEASRRSGRVSGAAIKKRLGLE